MGTPHKLTPEQEKAIGHLVADNWGAHFQTGMIGSTPILYVKAGLNFPFRSWSINADGTVLIQEYE